MWNIEFLKDEYSEKLLEYFKSRIYEILAAKKDRELYKSK